MIFETLLSHFVLLWLYALHRWWLGLYDCFACSTQGPSVEPGMLLCCDLRVLVMLEGQPSPHQVFHSVQQGFPIRGKSWWSTHGRTHVLVCSIINPCSWKPTIIVSRDALQCWFWGDRDQRWCNAASTTTAEHSGIFNCNSLKTHNWSLFFLHVFTYHFYQKCFYCHLFTHTFSHYCTAHAASSASPERPLYNDVQYLHNKLNMDESGDPDTRRDNWNKIIFLNHSCNCEQPRHTGGVHLCLAWADTHANGMYLIMLH